MMEFGTTVTVLAWSGDVLSAAVRLSRFLLCWGLCSPSSCCSRDFKRNLPLSVVLALRAEFEFTKETFCFFLVVTLLISLTIKKLIILFFLVVWSSYFFDNDLKVLKWKKKKWWRRTNYFYGRTLEITWNNKNLPQKKMLNMLMNW